MKLYTRYFNNTNSDHIGNLVIIHGLGEHCGRYVHFIKNFTEAGFKVYTFDLPGHGMTKGKKGELKSFNEIYAFIEEYVPEDYFLFGHSLGGLIATRFSSLTENKPKKLILSAPAIGDIIKQKKLLKILSIFPNLTISNKIKPSDLSTNKLAVDKYINDPLVHDKITVNTLKQFVIETNLALENISKFEIDTLLLFGAKDIVIDIEQYEKFINEKVKKISFKNGKHELFECDYHKDDYKDSILKFMLSDN